MGSINLDRHRLARGRLARVRVALVCGLTALLVQAGARAGQDGGVNPFEGAAAARRAGAA